jgi:hypothetical protein
MNFSRGYPSMIYHSVPLRASRIIYPNITETLAKGIQPLHKLLSPFLNVGAWDCHRKPLNHLRGHILILPPYPMETVYIYHRRQTILSLDRLQGSLPRP